MIVEITINGEVKQLKFANYALEKYTTITGVGIGEVKEPNDTYSQLDMVRDLIFCGLYGYYRSNGLVFDVKIEDVEKWMDEISQADQLQVVKGFTNAVLKLTNDMLASFKAMAGSDEKKK